MLTGCFGSFDIAVDTAPPSQPIVEPSLDQPAPETSDYQSRGYPINYVDGVYYTNKEDLFITGYTDELLDMIAVTSVGAENKETTT